MSNLPGTAMVAESPRLPEQMLQEGARAWFDQRDDMERYALLREFRRKRVFRFETGLTAPATIIAKAWAIGRGPWYRRVTRALWPSTRASEREFRIARHLTQRAPLLAVPFSIERFHRIEVARESCEVVLSEDLGDCVPLPLYIQEHRASADAIEAVEFFAIESAAAMLLDARVIDDDHKVGNMLYSKRTSAFHRIDFEAAVHWHDCVDPGRAIGRMLGRLTATYARAFQPDPLPVNQMICRLVRRLEGRLPARSWGYAYKTATAALERHRRTSGIDIRPDFAPIFAASTS